MRKEEDAMVFKEKNHERTGCKRGTRLDMGQYGLEEMGTPLTYDKQNALYIFCRTRTSKELDCGLQEGQAR
jgi:hypothetical protein